VRRLFSVLIGVVLLGMATASGAPLRVMLDFFVNPNHVPLVVAQDEGLFAEEGVDVEILIPSSASDPVKLVAAGAVDVALTPQINFMIARCAGLPVIAIGALIGSPLGGLLSLEGKGIHTLADLRGRRIGYSLAPLEPTLWTTMLSAAGVGRDDFELVNVGFNTVLSLLTGKVDAIGAFRTFEVPQVALLGRFPVFFPEEDYGVPRTQELVLVVNAETLDRRAAQWRGLIAGLARGIALTQAQPDRAFLTFLDAYPDLDDVLNRRSFELTVSLFAKGAGLASPEEWTALQDYLLANGLIESSRALEDLYTDRFLVARPPAG